MIRRGRSRFGILALAAMLAGGCVAVSEVETIRPVSMEWREKINRELPALGHRNWIVVADSAYPRQSAPGIETVATGAGQLEVVEYVLDRIEQAPHVDAVVLLDAELEHVAEADAPGVEAYRTELKRLLNTKQVQVMPHEDIIAKLDEGSKLFNVLVLKTDMVLPYTTVFLELDCGYWNADAEQRLRKTLQNRP